MFPKETERNLNTVEDEFNIWPAGTISSYDYDELKVTEGNKSNDELDEIRRDKLDGIKAQFKILIDVGLTVKCPGAKEAYNRFLDLNSGQNCEMVCGTVCKNMCRTYTIDFNQMLNESEDARTLRNEDINSILRAAEIFITEDDMQIGDSISFAQTDRSPTSTTANDILKWELIVNTYETTSKCTVTKTGSDTYSAIITYYLYDVFDWNRNSTENFTFKGIDSGISQRDLWELQYGGYGKGYLVTGQISYTANWTHGDIVDNNINSILSVNS